MAIERYKSGELNGTQVYFGEDGKRLPDVVYEDGKRIEQSAKPVKQTKNKKTDERLPPLAEILMKKGQEK